MKLLNADSIIRIINQSRVKYTQGNLADDIKSSTTESFWLQVQKSSVIKKRQLIQMAKNKQPKPTEKHPLGTCLHAYINIKNACYDHEFTQRIKQLAPDWLIKKSDISKQKKQQLIQMAKNNQPRPIYGKNPLAKSFQIYIDKSSRSYDPVFSQTMKELAPNWFTKTSSIKKQQLLIMAKNNQPRPNKRKHPLGNAFNNYVTRTNNCYDPVFTKKLKKLAPHWFTHQSDVASQKNKGEMK